MSYVTHCTKCNAPKSHNQYAFCNTCSRELANEFDSIFPVINCLIPASPPIGTRVEDQRTQESPNRTSYSPVGSRIDSSSHIEKAGS